MTVNGWNGLIYGGPFHPFFIFLSLTHQLIFRRKPMINKKIVTLSVSLRVCMPAV